MACENFLPKLVLDLINAGVRMVSFKFWPVRRLSLCWVKTPQKPLGVAGVIGDAQD